jgi:hypothetical protein
VDRVGTRPARGVHDAIDAQVAVGGRIGPDRHCLVGHAHMPRRAIALGVDRDRGHAHVAARANDPHRDLAAVGDKDLQQNPKTLTDARADRVGSRVVRFKARADGTARGLVRSSLAQTG